MTKPEQTPEKMATCAGRYARSAEVAGKMLGHLVAAGCFSPSVLLFGDGSGHFAISRDTAAIADKVFVRFLGEVPCKFQDSRQAHSDIEYDINYDTFDTYQDVCHACERPL